MLRLLWIMATVIGTTILGTISSGTGFGFQRHLVWAANDAAWYFFYIASTDTTHLLTYRSPDGTTWTAKNSYLVSNSQTVGTDARNFGVYYANISTNDVFHVAFEVNNTTAHHNRGVASAGNITWGTDAAADSNACALPAGPNTVISANGTIYDAENPSGSFFGIKGTNTDSGSAWTSGFGASFDVDGNMPGTPYGFCMVPCNGTTKILALYNNGNSGTFATSMTNVLAKTIDGTTVTPSSASNGISVFTAFTARDPNSFGVARVDDTHVHVVCQNSSNTFVHKIINGNGAGNPTISAGATIPNQTSLAGGGCPLVTDGNGNLYLFIIDTDAPNTVRYIKYNGSTWGTWTALESTTQTRTFVTASPTLDASGNIGVCWTQKNGSNFDVAFTTLATSTATGTPTRSIYVQESTPWEAWEFEAA